MPTSDISANRKYEVIWADLSDSEAATEYDVAVSDVRAWRSDYGQGEELLIRMRERLKRRDLQPEIRDHIENCERGLRFFLGCWFGRPCGGGRLDNDFMDAFLALRREHKAGAFGNEKTPALYRLVVGVGRALREHDMSNPVWRPFGRGGAQMRALA